MKSSSVTEETSAELLQWMSSVRACVLDWTEPGTENSEGGRPPFFDLDALKKRQVLAVPFVNRWFPSSTPIIDASKLAGKEKLYATGVHPCPEPTFSSSTKAENLDDMMMMLSYHCVTTPRDESFMILNTYLDYWIFAGPHKMVEAACGGSISAAFTSFADSVIDFGDQFEAGPEFATHIVKALTEHNASILSDP